MIRDTRLPVRPLPSFSRRLLLGSGAGVTAAGMLGAPAAAHAEGAPSIRPAEPEAGGTRIVDVALADAETVDDGAGGSARELTVDGASMLACTWTEGAPEHVSIRSRSSEDEPWSEWVKMDPLEADDEGTVPAREGTQAVWLGGPAQGVQIRALGGRGDAAGAVTAHLIHPAEPVAAPRMRTFALQQAPAAAAPSSGALKVVSRAAWGADESLVSGPPSTASVLKAAVLHHTEGTNSYTAAQVPGMLRGYLSYHTRVQGWRDIGYNVLVDRFGTIYEGRAGGLERHVVGAHATGSNTGTVGVAMIGSTMSAKPAAAMLASVADVMAWKLGGSYIFDVRDEVEVDSKRIPRVIGHRDARSVSTDCPGTEGYRALGQLRDMVQSRLGAYRTAVASRWADEGGVDTLGSVIAIESARGTDMVTRYSSGLEILRDAKGALRVVDPSYKGAVERIGGADRYAVSAAASKRAYPNGAKSVHIASGEVYTDALAAGPAAAAAGGPLLLVRRSRVPDAVAAELRRLKPASITIGGGTGTVSAAVQSQLASLTGARVTRVGGADRYEVAASLARTGVPLFVASGEIFSDALSAGSSATIARGSVLLTRKGALPPATEAVIRRSAGQTVTILGGTATVSAAVENRIASLGAKVRRVEGSDRYAVSANAATLAAPSGSATVLIASGESFPDALSASTIAAATGAPILLSRRTTLSARALCYARTKPTTRAIIVGGEAAVAAGVIGAA